MECSMASNALCGVYTKPYSPVCTMASKTICGAWHMSLFTGICCGFQHCMWGLGNASFTSACSGSHTVCAVCSLHSASFTRMHYGVWHCAVCFVLQHVLWIPALCGVCTNPLRTLSSFTGVFYINIFLMNSPSLSLWIVPWPNYISTWWAGTLPKVPLRKNNLKGFLSLLV